MERDFWAKHSEKCRFFSPKRHETAKDKGQHSTANAPDLKEEYCFSVLILFGIGPVYPVF
jgi:hypothetical protein